MWMLLCGYYYLTKVTRYTNIIHMFSNDRYVLFAMSVCVFVSVCAREFSLRLCLYVLYSLHDLFTLYSFHQNASKIQSKQTINITIERLNCWLKWVANERKIDESPNKYPYKKNTIQRGAREETETRKERANTHTVVPLCNIQNTKTLLIVFYLPFF